MQTVSDTARGAGDFANGLPLYEHRHEILPRTGPPPDAPT